MNPKIVIASVVTLAGLLVTAWKGPSTWGAISAALTAACVLALPLLAKATASDPKLSAIEEYVADLEDELELLSGTGACLAALKQKHGRPQ